MTVKYSSNQWKEIADFLIKLIEVRKWSKAEFARRAGIAKQSVNKYLNAELNPENLLLSLQKSGEQIDLTQFKIISENKPTYYESRVGHFTEEEKKQLDKFISELINESKEVRHNTIELARVALKQQKKQKGKH